jgi:predicted O-linked N-acetylglucosamine transferase (SPINDLY family)
MEIFKNLYKNIISHKNNNIKELYQNGISILENNNYENQFEILTKLIYFFPNDYLLYYFMGYIHLNKNENLSLMYFKLSFEKNPDFLENVLDLSKILMDKDYSNELFKYLKDEDVIKFNYDKRYILLIASAYMKIDNFNKSLNFFNLLLKEEENINKLLKIKIYNNIAHLYSNLKEMNKSNIYFQKAFDLLLSEQKNSFNIDLQLNEILSNIMTNQDYDYYHDLNLTFEDKFKNYDLVNQLYKNQNIFTFDLINNFKNNPFYKIKIGYISSDYFNHAVTNFILPLITLFDESKFELYLYFNNDSSIDLKPYKNILEKVKFYNIYQVKIGVELAHYIKSHQIDILIDLKGHTSKNRLDVFALKPAPIQMTYLGFPNTTGLKTIDYRITDKIADHLESKQLYSEKLIYMNKCFLCYHNILQKEKVKNKEFYSNIILGSLNKELKISKDVLRCWKKIIQNTPSNVKLLLKLDNEKESIYLEEKKNYFLQELDCSSDRIIFVPKTSQSDYFQLFSFFDILLDTFPYSGTTTTCNTLFNSLPVITLYNQNSHVQSVSSSLLINSGFPELVAYSEEEYVQKVIYLTQDIERIKMYKETIHLKFKELMNPELFVKEFENILTELYHKHFIN